MQKNHEKDKNQVCKNISLSRNNDLMTFVNVEAKVIFKLLLCHLNDFCLLSFFSFFFFFFIVMIIFLNRNRAVADTLCSTHSESWHDLWLFLLKSWLIVYIYYWLLALYRGMCLQFNAAMYQ